MAHIPRTVHLAFRRLQRSPGFTAVAILTLALGVGVNTTTFTAINTILLRPLPVAHPEQLVFLNKGNSAQKPPVHSYPDYLDLRDRNTVLAGLAAYRFLPASLSASGNNSRIWGYLATGNYFDMLGVTALRGRTFHPEDDGQPGAHPVVVVSYACWQRRFGGDPDIAGKRVKLNGLDYTLIGVMPPGFTGTELFFAPEFWAPYAMQAQLEGFSARESRGNQGLALLGRLKPGVTSRQCEAALDSIAVELGREHPIQDLGMHIRLSPPGLAGNYLRGPVVGFATVLAAVAGLVLLIACTNLASLLLARAADRRKETAICLALGAGRSHIIWQLLIESLAVSLAGGVAGYFLALWLTSLFTAWRPPIDFALNLTLAVDLRVFGFALAASCLACLLFGLLPSVQAARTELVPALKNEAPLGRLRRWPLRDLLVASQIGLSMVLLVACLLVIRSLDRALKIDVGFNPQAAVSASLDLQLEGYTEPRGRDFQRRLLDTLATLPQVQSAAFTNRLPLSLDRSYWSVYIEGQPVTSGATAPTVIPYKITPGYFATMQTRLIAGRDFDARDGPDSRRVAIVNQAFAQRFLPGEDALGKRFRTGSPKSPLIEIAGIAEDGKYESLNDSAKPVVFLPLAQQYGQEIVIVVRSSAQPKAALDAIRRAVAAIDPAITLYEAGTLTEHLGMALFPARIAAVALAVFGLLAITLAATGVYGVMAYAVARRTREIGIRMAIGATPRSVLRSVLGRTAALLGAGTLLGMLMTLGLTRFFAPLLYNVSPRDPAAFTLAIALITAIALVASLVPARRAISIDAMTALREE